MDAIESFLSGAVGKSSAGQPKQDYSGVVTDALLDSVRQKESSGGLNVGPHPKSGAAGPYQHIPGTQRMLAAKYGDYDPYNETQARERTRQYLTDLVAQNKGDVRGALKQYGGWITKDGTGYVNDIIEGANKGVGKTSQAPSDGIESFLSGVSKGSGEETSGLNTTKAQRETVLGTEIAPKEKKETTLGEKALGLGETALTMGTGAISGITGQVAGIAKNVFGGTWGTKEGTDIAAREAERIQQAGTYMPRTEAGKETLKTVGEAFEASKLPPVIPEAMGLNVARPGAMQYAKGQVQEAVAPVVEKARQYIPQGKPAMAGVGAAEVNAQNLRRARADELPIPMGEDLMKSDITRRPEDIQFAKTMGKDPRYAAIFQENASVKNEKLQRNLQALSEQTGAQQLGIEPAQLGQQLVDVVGKAKETRYQTVKDAYKVARDAGEMSEAIPVEALQQFVKNNASASKNAPVISAIGSEVKRLAKNNDMTLNDVEELRKMVTVLQQDSGPNSYYASQALKLIDRMTEGKGGDLYKQARGLYHSYKKEFENTPIVREILSTKPGTTERTVALESLVDRTLLNKSTQEVQKLFGSLTRMEGGPEIINELKGALADKIAQEVTKGSGTDMYGRPYVSAAAFKKTLDKLDKGGKLDFIFGKRQAEQYRTLHKTAEDILTIPKEVVSTSGSGETVKAVLTGLAEAGAWSLADMGGVPVGTIARYGTKAYKEKKQLNKINEFVNYGKTK